MKATWGEFALSKNFKTKAFFGRIIRGHGQDRIGTPAGFRPGGAEMLPQFIRNTGAELPFRKPLCNFNLQPHGRSRSPGTTGVGHLMKGEQSYEVL